MTLLKLSNICFIVLFLIGTVSSNRVLELSDRFLDVRGNGVWLIMFYAPWCGHCKNLDPVWNQVAQSLVDTEIRVGRIDCTRFSSVASEYSVSGFPTILFVKGHKAVEYRGDRDRHEIVEFARRMDGPAVRYFGNCNQFKDVVEGKKVFFVFLDDSRLQETYLRDNYTRVSEEFLAVMNFYSTSLECMADRLGSANEITNKKSIFVCKDGACFPFDEELMDSQNVTLRDWVNKERFPAFMKISSGNFHQLLKTGRCIVMAVLEENQIGGLTLKMFEFRDVLEAIAINNKNLYHDDFLFGWLGNPDIANNIAMETLPIPSLIVLNTSSYQYFLPKLEEGEKVPSPQSILKLLDQVKNKTAKVYGGESFGHKLYRAYYGAKTSLFGMWRGNPVLTTVLLGLPLGLFSIICYTTCCTDILEASDEDDEAAELMDAARQQHQKRE